MPPEKKGFFRNIPYGNRVILVLAVLLFVLGQFVGKWLNVYGYDWLAWL